jgi:hypothetical protein
VHRLRGAGYRIGPTGRLARFHPRSRRYIVTTPNPEDFIGLVNIKDKESLQFVGRLIESQRVVLEAQLTQMKQLQEAVNARMQNMR